jgi:DNA-binding response OmpR family regulator
MVRILLVDDYPCLRRLITEELFEEGYRVQGTGDSESVADMLRCTRPDLVVLDLFLNKRARWDVLGDIKRHNAALPVIIFTAYDGYKNDPRASLGDAFLIKSCDLDPLKHAIRELLARQSNRKVEMLTQAALAKQCSWRLAAVGNGAN